jgi:Xaa-Pro aminopeptidase
MDKVKNEKNLLLKSVRGKVSKLKIDAFLVTAEKDIIYLTGFFMSGAKLLIPKEGKPIYFIDKMNAPLANEKLCGLLVDEIISGNVLGNIVSYIKAVKIKRLGINSKKLSLFAYKALKKKLSNLKISDHDPVEGLRLIKTDLEVATLRTAAKKTIKVWRSIKKSLKLGMTEFEIVQMIDVLIRESGGVNSFTTIAAIGENAAYPHAIPTKRKLKENELFLTDFGMIHEGYCSDLTRTWYKGRINRQIREFVTQVQKAHDLAIKMAKPGVMIGRLVKEVNNVIIKNNFGEYICHGLGHGVGLDIHEEPFLSVKSQERLKKGMVITIEPGLYKPGLGGVREEDMVLITKNGCEVLTK